jgi:hypothetical protein
MMAQVGLLHAWYLFCVTLGWVQTLIWCTCVYSTCVPATLIAPLRHACAWQLLRLVKLRADANKQEQLLSLGLVRKGLCLCTAPLSVCKQTDLHVGLIHPPSLRLQRACQA